MAISLSLMDTCFKRFIQLDDGKHKEKTLEVLRLSSVDNFESCYLHGMEIINYLFDGDLLKSKQEIISGWHSKVFLGMDRIKWQKRIVNTLYEENKYYLDNN